MTPSVLYLWAVVAINYMVKSSLASPSPPSPSPSVVGQRGYSRFHANDSLIGQAIPCTDEEKLCFQYNMLYDSAVHGCSYSSFMIGDREQFWHMSRHLTPVKGTGDDRCYYNGGIRMAYDSNCYQSEIVYDTICGCNDTTTHILGGSECRCSAPTPIHVMQPEEKGHCLIPDMRFADNRSHLFQNPFEDIQGFKIRDYRFIVSEPLPRFSCSLEQAQCFSEGKVWVAEGKGCFPLLEKGPCAEDYVVALDAKAAREGRAEATCVHVRGGCPQGHVRMVFDTQCHSENDLSILLPDRKYRNQFGIFFATAFTICDYIPIRENVVDAHNVCSVTLRSCSGGGGAGGGIPCHTNNGCNRMEASSDLPKPM